MSLFAAMGVATPTLAAGIGVTLSDGMLAGHILAEPSLFFPADSGLLADLSGATAVRNRAVREAAGCAELWAATDRLASVGRTRPNGGRSTAASLARAEGFLLRISTRARRALADPALPSEYRRLLQRLTVEHPRLLPSAVGLRNVGPRGADSLRPSGPMGVQGVSGLSTRAPCYEGGAAAELVTRLVSDVARAHGGYNGWQSFETLPGIAEIGAVGSALEALYGPVVAESFQDEVLGEALRLLTLRERPDLLAAYRDLGDLSLALEHNLTQGELATALPGSKERIEAYWRLLALRHEMLSRPDFSHPRFRDLQTELAHPVLTREERTILARINEGAENRLERAGRLFRLEVLDAIRYFYRQAEEASLLTDVARKLGFFDVVQQLAGLALKIGIGASDISWATEGARSEPQTTPVSLGAVQEGAYELSVSALPSEIRQALEVTGHLGLVEGKVRRVILMPELASSDQIRNLVGSVPHGRAFFADGTVVVATRSRDPKSGRAFNLRPWQVAALLTHESTHLRWMSEITTDPDGALLISNVPNEREAHAEELRFYEAYLASEGDRLSPLDRLSLEQNIFSRAAVVHACNLLLGLPLLDLEPGRRELPSPERFARFGLPGIRALDLNPYPTSLQALIGRITFPDRLSELELASLRSRLKERLARLEGSYRRLERAIMAELQTALGRPGGGGSDPRLLRELAMIAQALPGEMASLRAHYEALFGL